MFKWSCPWLGSTASINQKLLSAANRLIYLNISISVLGPHSFLHSITPGCLARRIFLHSITISGETTSRYLFQHGKLAKIIIICENNSSRENNWPFIVDVRRVLNMHPNAEYASVLNIPGIWICFWFWIC